MTRRSAIALILVLAVVLPAFGERLLILYTNDIHLRLERLSSIERLVSAARSRGDPVLLLDAGDTWHDFRVPLYAVWGADRMVEWMSRAGYDAMAPGNHDFYVGWPRMSALAAAAAFPLLCANLTSVDGIPSPFPGSTRVAVGDLDVLVVGLTALELLPAFDVPWLRPVDPIEALRREIGAAPGTPDLVVCLAHISVRDAETLARAVPDVDVFVTGHSHEAAAAPRLAGGAVIVQSGAYGRAVGEILLDVNSGTIRLVDDALVPTQAEAATDTGRGLAAFAEVVLAILVFSLALAL